MVRADRDSGDFCSVLSRAQSAARTGAKHDARGRGRDARVVHETEAARGGSRLQLRLSDSAQEKVAEVLRTYFARIDTELLSAASVQPQLRNASRRLVRAGASG